MTSTLWLMEPSIRFNFPNNHTSFVVYWPKCNCRCFYCDLSKVFINCIPFDKEALELSLPYIDCLVVSGGEPLLDFKRVLEFQEFAKNNNLWFYVYTNGYDLDKVNLLLSSYDKTKIVIDVKGNSVEQINQVTSTNLGEKFLKTYEQLANNPNVIFRFNDYIKPTRKYKNIETYEIH